MSRRLPAALVTAVVALLAMPHRSPAQSSGFVAGTRDLFVLDMASTPLGELPQACGPKRPPPCVETLRGNLTTVDKDGSHMLRAADPAELWIKLAEVMPADFTIEIDLVPKTCCNPSDLEFDGSRAHDRGPASTQLEWNPSSLYVIGGGEPVQVAMPDELKAAIPAELTEVRASIDAAGTFKVYTNGKRILNLPNRKFAHTRGLWIALGGQDDNKYAVYVAKIRIATNSPKPQ